MKSSRLRNPLINDFSTIQSKLSLEKRNNCLAQKHDSSSCQLHLAMIEDKDKKILELENVIKDYQMEKRYLERKIRGLEGD